MSDQDRKLDSGGSALEALLATHYGLRQVTTERFAPVRPTFLVRSASGTFVARVGERLAREVACLSALEASTHPAPRIIPTLDGHSFAPDHRAEGRDVRLMTYVEGVTPDMQPSQLRQLGAALGRLHHHGPSITRAVQTAGATSPPVDRAFMLPGNELSFALRTLLPFERQSPNPQTARQWQRLVDACTAGKAAPPDLTDTFLHGDAHPWNSVLTPTGRVQFIDWGGAGPGPAIIDLAFLVMSVATDGLIYPVTRADPDMLDALLAGYQEHTTLSRADGDHLEQALAFRVLVCAAVGFGHVLAAGKDPLLEPSIQWSLERLQAVPQLAEAVRVSLQL